MNAKQPTPPLRRVVYETIDNSFGGNPMKPQNLARLLRELADGIDKMRQIMCDTGIGAPVEIGPTTLAIRARAAAEEIEARKVPTDDEIIECYSQAATDYIDTLERLATEQDHFDAKAYGLHAVLDRFGGGEAQ